MHRRMSCKTLSPPLYYRELAEISCYEILTRNSMADVDDDVRTVAASALLPIAGTLASALSDDELRVLLSTLWGCLEGGSDDLGSSTGAVMELLGEQTG